MAAAAWDGDEGGGERDPEKWGVGSSSSTRPAGKRLNKPCLYIGEEVSRKGKNKYRGF